jgi:hypothetical protein
MNMLCLCIFIFKHIHLHIYVYIYIYIHIYNADIHQDLHRQAIKNNPIYTYIHMNMRANNSKAFLTQYKATFKQVFKKNIHIYVFNHLR